MRLKIILAAMLFAAGSVGAAAPALAQGVEFGPDGIIIDPGIRNAPPPPPLFDEAPPLLDEAPLRPHYGDGISRREAMRIARWQGVVDVDGVRPGPRGGWVVFGLDRFGEDMRVVVSRFGEVMSVR